LLLEVRGISVFYGNVQILDKVSFHVEKNEIVAMIGPNGAGKTTALRAVSGLIWMQGGRIEGGEILFEGKSIKNRLPHELTRLGIVVIPQGRNIFPSMSVLENLEVSGYLLKKNELKKRIELVLDFFPMLKKKLFQIAGTLSGGEQQMLALGKALILKPKLLLLDEPSVGLSPNYVKQVFEKIKEICSSYGISVLMVEQNVRAALKYANRVYVFSIGKIEKVSTPEELSDKCIKEIFFGQR